MTRAFDVIALPSEGRFNREFFVTKVMDRFVRMRTKKRPMMQARAKFWYGNPAHPHLTPETSECHGIGRLPHRASRPDLSQADFWLFGYIKRTLERFCFRDVIEAKDRIMEILRAIHFGTFIRIFDEWKERLVECISRNGESL